MRRLFGWSEQLANDPVLTFIALVFAVILLASLWAAVSLLRDRWRAYLAGAQAEIDAAVNHTDDCVRCAPARERLQELDPLHGLTEREFLDLVNGRRSSRPVVDDAGRWVRS